MSLTLARFAGTFAGYLARRRQMFEALAIGDELHAVIAGVLEQAMWLVMWLMPALTGPRSLEMLRDGGLVQLLVRTARSDPRQLGRRFMAMLIAWRIAMVAVTHKGATFSARNDRLSADPKRFLDAAFSATNRRAAQRVLAEHTRRIGVGEVRLDFAAMYRTGRCSPVTHIGAATIELSDLSFVDVLLIMTLIALIFACDCWALRENPLNVAYLALVKQGNDLWESGSAGFRDAMTEALVLATCETIPAERLV